MAAAELPGLVAPTPPGAAQGAARFDRLSGNAGSKPNSADQRTASEKDRGRLRYSPFLRRLSGVTQVVPPDLSVSRRHTRASHTEKVALVALEIANDLTRRQPQMPHWVTVIDAAGGFDATACEVAGLAHDLGHPPFGHAGEVVLNRMLRRNGVDDGFEGNAQSFRIVTRLDRRKPDSKLGLDLSRVVLAAILKYPRLCPASSLTGGEDAPSALERPPKFGAYRSDEAAFSFASRLFLSGATEARQTLEGSVMDLADDITYAVHDFEDAYIENVIDFSVVVRDLDLAQSRVRTTSLDDLERETSNHFIHYAAELYAKYRGYFHKGLYANALGTATSLIEQNHFLQRFTGSPEQAAEASAALSDVIEQMFHGLELSASPPWENGPSVFVDAPSWHLIQVLKTITRRYVVGTSRIGVLERSQAVVIETLYEGFRAWLESGPRVSELPQPLSQYLVDGDKAYNTYDSVHVVDAVEHRALADYICSLSDRECLDQSQWFLGSELPPVRAGL